MRGSLSCTGGSGEALVVQAVEGKRHLYRRVRGSLSCTGGSGEASVVQAVERGDFESSVAEGEGEADAAALQSAAEHAKWARLTSDETGDSEQANV